jgi:hypothetical protein
VICPNYNATVEVDLPNEAKLITGDHAEKLTLLDEALIKFISNAIAGCNKSNPAQQQLLSKSQNLMASTMGSQPGLAAIQQLNCFPLQWHPTTAKAPQLRTYSALANETSKKGRLNGGRYRDRTYDHYDVNVVLYR